MNGIILCVQQGDQEQKLLSLIDVPGFIRVLSLILSKTREVGLWASITIVQY